MTLRRQLTGGDAPGDEVERMAAALTRLGERTLTWPELCQRAGVEHSVADPLWRALGFPDVPIDVPAYTPDDVRALEIAAEGIQQLAGPERDDALELIVHEARAVGGHLARIAETELDTLGELGHRGLRASAVADAFAHGVDRSPIGWLVMYALRRRLDEAIRRRGESTDQGLVVGFVDLVDFTRASSGLDVAEFGRVLERFEARAWDHVTEAGGQVVKLLGDEAMFVCPDAADAGRAALAILQECGNDGLPPARAGLAAGRVLSRVGDYFGPVVNLASRLVDTAPPDAVAIDRQFRSMLPEPARRRLAKPLGSFDLKGFGPTSVWRLGGAA